jgi:hypothetical protein
MAKIFIKRTKQWSFGLVPIKILLDGKEIAKIKSGGSCEFTVEEGHHLMQAVFFRTGSNVHEFNATFSSLLYFELGSDVNMLKNLILILKHPLILVSLYFLDKLINWDYFLLFSLLGYLSYELFLSAYRKKQRKLQPEKESYYIYLREVK